VVMESFQSKEHQDWQHLQEVKAETDDNFIDPNTDSTALVQVWLGGRMVREIRARVEWVAGPGYFVSDRLGRRWALVSTPENDKWLLELRDHVSEIMKDWNK
jgi:hypothetical protein